jgi:hypothetical protein
MKLHMKLHMFLIAVVIALGIVFAGTIGAFLLYVPVLTIFSVSAVLLGFVVMFGLGMQAGGRRIRVKRTKMSPHIGAYRLEG